MSERQPAKPEYLYEGYAPATGEYGKWSRAFWQAADFLDTLWEKSYAPGQPLHTVSNITKQAPLGSLFVAFVLGVAFATRRVNPR